MLDMLYIKVIKKYSLLDIAKHIHRHKAASRGCLFMAPMCRSKLCEVAVSSPWSALILEALSRPRSSHSYSD